MTEIQATKIYTILVDRFCATERNRSSFISYMTLDDVWGGHEWRFGGALGFGGKLYSNAGRVYVSYYPEDMTEELDSIVSEVNEAIIKAML